jgi:hypothetical protein
MPRHPRVHEGRRNAFISLELKRVRPTVAGPATGKIWVFAPGFHDMGGEYSLGSPSDDRSRPAHGTIEPRPS